MCLRIPAAPLGFTEGLNCSLSLSASTCVTAIVGSNSVFHAAVKAVEQTWVQYVVCVRGALCKFPHINTSGSISKVPRVPRHMEHFLLAFPSFVRRSFLAI